MAKRQKSEGPKASVLSTAINRLNLPEDALLGAPRVTLSGSHRVLIENHRGLKNLESELVLIAGKRVQIRIRGTELNLETMNASEMLISGQIFSVEIE